MPISASTSAAWWAPDATQVRLSPSLPRPLTLPVPRARTGRRRVRRGIGLLLLVSAWLHLTVLAVLLLQHHAPPSGAVSPPSFDMVMEPGTPTGKLDEARPAQIPAPAAPSPPPPPAAAAPPAAQPPPAAVAAPAPAPPADAPVRLSLAQPPPLPLPPLPPFTMPEPPAELSPAAPSATGHRPAPAFPAPMDISLGRPVAPPQPVTHGTGALDLAIGPDARKSNGAPPRDTSAAEGMIRVRGASVGKDWLERLHEWWEQHSYYPDQAVLRGEDGTVQIHVRVDRFGRVQLVELESPSGSQWLDAGAQAVFRGATVPPFPPATPEPFTDLDITIDYVLMGKGAR